MLKYDDLINIPLQLQKSFGLSVDYYFNDGDLFLKMPGIDSYSLGKYIQGMYEVGKVTVKYIEPYRIATDYFIKVSCGRKRILEVQK